MLRTAYEIITSEKLGNHLAHELLHTTYQKREKRTAPAVAGAVLSANQFSPVIRNCSASSLVRSGTFFPVFKA